MEPSPVQEQILQLVTAQKRVLLSQSKTRIVAKKKQLRWIQLHAKLVNEGTISPHKLWTYTRYLWYRMSAIAKLNLRKYSSGQTNYLHQQDRKVLDLLKIPIVPPVAQQDNVMEERTMRVECVEVDCDVTAPNPSNMSDTELRKSLLLQEYRLNEYELLKMKFYFLKAGHSQMYNRCLRQ